MDDGQQQPHGITPAYAGNTIVPGCFAVFRWDHPRLRGEYQVESDDRRTIQGSPPLTRGILSITMVPSACPRITPAYAGNTVCIDCIFRSIEDHPRLRGEYYSTIGVAIVTAGSPPLTRGIPKGTAAQNRDYGITPAYAGNTPDSCPSRQRAWDHPPLTRGIQSPFWASACAARITPAYAGNTSPHSASCSDSWDHPRLRGEYCYK